MFNLDSDQIKFKIKHLFPHILGKFKQSGYQPLSSDFRDFKLGSWFGSQPYKPQSQRLELKTLSVKDQGRFNDCVWISMTVGKEIDENTVLAQRSIVSYAKRNNLLTGNGYANLRDAQKVLQNWGIEEANVCPDGNFPQTGDFDGYVNATLDQSNAAIHKSKSFWSVDTKDDILKMLDQGRWIHAAMLWYSGYNQGGGFSSPWLITKTLGYAVGGHAILIRGYDLNYQGRAVFILQNSYSALWGDNGKFYVDMDFMIQEINRPGYGAYVNLDLESNLGGFINQYSGQDVKVFNGPAIYHIQNGQKKLYPDWLTFLAWTGASGSFAQLNQADTDVLNNLPSGDNMDITKTVYWPILQTLSAPDNLNKLLEILHKK